MELQKRVAEREKAQLCERMKKLWSRLSEAEKQSEAEKKQVEEQLDAAQLQLAKVRREKQTVVDDHERTVEEKRELASDSVAKAGEAMLAKRNLEDAQNKVQQLERRVAEARAKQERAESEAKEAAEAALLLQQKAAEDKVEQARTRATEVKELLRVEGVAAAAAATAAQAEQERQQDQARQDQERK